MAAEFETIFFGIFIVFYLIMFMLGIAFYILNSLGLYTIAKRRGIENPWLAWIPIGTVYTLGAIADDYNLKVRAKNTSHRKIMLYLMVAMIAGYIGLYPILFTGIYSIMETDGTGIGVLAIVALVVIYLFIMGTAITVSVFQYISYYRIFQAGAPKNAVMFLILSLFITGALPFIIFFIRNSDKGMPEIQTEIVQGEN